MFLIKFKLIITINPYGAANLDLAATGRDPEGGRLMEVQL